MKLEDVKIGMEVVVSYGDTPFVGMTAPPPNGIHGTVVSIYPRIPGVLQGQMIEVDIGIDCDGKKWTGGHFGTSDDSTCVSRWWVDSDEIEPFSEPVSTRKLAYMAIDSERAYQDAGRGNAKRHDISKAMSPGEFILCMEKCLADARDAWYKPDGGTACLDYIRKVSALGVHAMELHGAPLRR